MQKNFQDEFIPKIFNLLHDFFNQWLKIVKNISINFIKKAGQTD